MNKSTIAQHGKTSALRNRWAELSEISVRTFVYGSLRMMRRRDLAISRISQRVPVLCTLVLLVSYVSRNSGKKLQMCRDTV